MRWACCAVLAASACYSPTFSGGEPCEVATNRCPSGQSCVASGADGTGVCTATNRSGDAGDDATSSGDGGACAGKLVTSKLLGSVCLSATPTAAVTLNATINTGSVASGTGCTEIVPQASGPSLCVIAGASIDIPSGVTVQGVALAPSGSTAAATSPLVLIATGSITIEGTLDVSSHFQATIGGIPALGAGARTATGCLVAGADGQAGTGNSGGGGGAGGSFGGAGAQGGTGGNNGNVGRGSPGAASPPTMLIGGCPGGKGGDGAGAPPGGDSSGGPGGSGGGAVLLLAGDSISITGKVQASGAGGSGGGPGFNSSGAGGGGGAGGMIGLEATRVTVTGSVFANGGGGGGGGGNVGDNDAGKPGTDPSVPLTAAAGGTATNSGGAGGAGSVGTTTPVAGKNGGGNQQECAGGGGGGGAGAIRVLGPAASSIGGTVSPPAM
ncbi:MAG TPA: hypothetical protein VHW23_08240 [Kofleriaceae bacterium]|jgi:hypothetical protein|nr:hypothetical protein [Kofleriaceae bacterium]